MTFALCAASARCATAPPRAELEAVLAIAAAPVRGSTRAAAGRSDAELASGTRLETVLELSLAANPDLKEAQQRVRASLERASQAARLPDLEFKAEIWAVPLARPYALGEAGMIMFGLRQMFPAPGSLDAASRAAFLDARVGAEALRGKEQDLVLAVRKAYAEFWRAETEHQVHVEHEALTEQMVGLARVSYKAGRSTQGDVLRLLVELSRLHSQLLSVEQERQTAQALLNTMMAREPGAPLGPPSELQLPSLASEADAKSEPEPELESPAIDPELPELKAAAQSVDRGAARLESARIAATRPSFMIGADYWNQPLIEPHNAYSAMFSMNLPWLNPRHEEEVREAEHALSADRSALESARNAARLRLREAWVRAQSAERLYRVIERDLLVQAKQSLDAAEASFATGRSDALGLLDALKSYLDVRLEHARSKSALVSALADLDRARGSDPRRILELETRP
jgi:outer membrane protein TolC